jgi:DMSO reductase anchor subunit
MGEAVTMKRIAEASPRFRAGITAAFYLLTMLMGGLVLFVHGRLALAVDLIATVCYAAVTALFYDLSRPVTGTVAEAGQRRRGNK